MTPHPLTRTCTGFLFRRHLSARVAAAVPIMCGQSRERKKKEDDRVTFTWQQHLL